MTPTHYDVFISRKSQDAYLAKELYDFLTSKGLKVFDSLHSLPELGNADYQKAIDHALDACTHMIVVGSSVENITSSWVEAEWRFFLNRIRSGKTKGNLLTVITNTLKIDDLPPSLQNFEVLNFTNYEKVYSYVKKSISPSIFFNPLIHTYKQPDYLYSQALLERSKGQLEYAFSLLSKASEQYHLDALNLLGYCYQIGEGTSTDYKKAFECFEKAAKRGHLDSQKNVGFFYATGKLGDFDDEKAVIWYQKAAERGNAIAQFNLAIHLELGNGVEKNIDLAREYFNLAAQQDYEPAQQALKRLNQTC